MVEQVSVMIKAATKAHKRRDVETIDIPGAYLHTDTDKNVKMIPNRILAEIMSTVDPRIYRKYCIMKRRTRHFCR